MEELKIRDLILTTDNNDEKEITSKKQVSDVTYEVVINSGCDFAIRRKTAKTSKLMVILPSQ